MKKLSLVTSFVLLALLLACSNRDQYGNQNGKASLISQNITKQSEAGGAIDLSIVGPASWERVCLLGPYSDNAAAEKVLGFKWDLRKNSSIHESDGANLLVFVRNQEVVAFTEHPRNYGDFVDVAGKCFDRREAKFDRQVGKDGWVRFVSK